MDALIIIQSTEIRKFFTKEGFGNWHFQKPFSQYQDGDTCMIAKIKVVVSLLYGHLKRIQFLMFVVSTSLGEIASRSLPVCLFENKLSGVYFWMSSFMVGSIESNLA